MINPLDTGEMFFFELMNPNPTSSKTKDGPKYRVSFELGREDWEMFMDANTSGMILEFRGRVTEHHTEEKLKGGRLARKAAYLCDQADFDEWAHKYLVQLYPEVDWDQEKDHGKALILQRCQIDSRRELDHNMNAAEIFLKIRESFYEH